MHFLKAGEKHFSQLDVSGMAIGFGSFSTGDIEIQTSYPSDWVDLYASNNWLASDPVVQIGAQKTGVAQWHIEKPTSTFQTAALDFGLARGLVGASEIGGHRCIAGLNLESGVHPDLLKGLQSEVRRMHLNHLMQKAEKLTDAQHELINLFAIGLRAKQIAAEFGISDDAVKQRKLTILKTLSVNNFLVAVNICSRLDETRHLINHGPSLHS